jgi:hypothetical protein
VNKEIKSELLSGRVSKTIINPYPPNFRRSPARIIEPATGAST